MRLMGGVFFYDVLDDDDRCNANTLCFVVASAPIDSDKLIQWGIL